MRVKGPPTAYCSLSLYSESACWAREHVLGFENGQWGLRTCVGGVEIGSGARERVVRKGEERSMVVEDKR